MTLVNHRANFTAEEIEFIRSAKSQGMTNADIAASVQRTRDAIATVNKEINAGRFKLVRTRDADQSTEPRHGIQCRQCGIEMPLKGGCQYCI